MRQIVLDTETTGLSTLQGHRIIEIGCVELYDRQLTGKYFHTYLNPMRKVDPGAFKIHGLGDEFLAKQPVFKDIVQDLLNFLSDAELIIHNAVFDLDFLNAELRRLKHLTSMESNNTIIDTLILARKKHPGQRNNLDALCKRYDISHIKRERHGALLDAEILAHVYLAMTGGQLQLNLGEMVKPVENTTVINYPVLSSTSPVYFADDIELQRHNEWLGICTK